MSTTIYHNPRCSKSRATLALLQEKGIEPEVIEYLKTPPTEAELDAILNKLDMEPADFMRTGEDEYKAHIKGNDLSRAEAIGLMVKYPRLIERPVVVNGEKAAVGRPPESVLAIL